MSRARTGEEAENTALAHLQQQGLTLLARNVRYRWGELDLVMQDGESLVFVEVRYRRRQDYGGAAASVDAGKQAKLIRAGLAYLQKLPGNPPPCRFDVVTVAPDAQSPYGALNWIRDAFRAD